MTIRVDQTSFFKWFLMSNTSTLLQDGSGLFGEKVWFAHPDSNTELVGDTDVASDLAWFGESQWTYMKQDI